MKKLLVLILIILLATSSIFASNAYAPMGQTAQTTMMTEQLDAAIGVSTLLFAGFAEFAYSMYGEVPGMSGTVGEPEPNIDITWNNCDVGLALGDDLAEPGEIVIESGSHVVYLYGEELHTKLDVIIDFNTEDEIDGTYRVVYESRTHQYGTDEEEEELLELSVDGNMVNTALLYE